jgi:[ribosomal protein S5]-alanine N-acetyltransferase
MILETSRLTLTPVTKQDFTTFYEMVINPFVREYLFDNTIIGEETVREFIATSIGSFQSGGYGLWLIQLKENAGIIGFTGLWHFFDEGQPQLLYALLPNHTKHGYAKEAAKRVIDYALYELKFEFLDASCDTPNSPSIQLAMSLGMVQTREEVMEGKPTTFFRICK